ncbi:uncharacterized protein LOC127289493 [Leptopilina boulardi]|uniref:uncharacterized protein LOC127289493 n=1 Tax=Leptopilina boulardi TaxID=63433 RepID=UPI0021F58A80|nr:uncharacterized protein LOC127289493 [Leptopilina boulardi]
MSIFLEPFVDHMNIISSNGVECTINETKLNIKIYPLVCCVDSVARAPVQGFIQFNGRFGCSQCLHPGEWTRSDPNKPRSGSIKYPLMDEIPKERNATGTVNHIKKAVEKKK